MSLLRASCLVTGAKGFVGSALMKRLVDEGAVTTGTARKPAAAGIVGGVARTELVRGPALDGAADWRTLVRDKSFVIHAAARVHVMHDREPDPLAAFRQVNVAGTLALARQAAQAGVQRFVFLSSVKVNGERTAPGQPFRADDPARPVDPYGLSKTEAEAGLLALASETGMEVTIIRPPLVYGPGVKGNFLAMMRWLRRGVPLPLGAVDNRRSLVALDNLVDLIAVCLRHPAAKNTVLLVSDNEDLSTSGLLRRLGAAMEVKTRLLPVPVPVLSAAAAILGKVETMRRITGNLQVDISPTIETLGWRPPVKVDEALAEVAAWFRAEGEGGISSEEGAGESAHRRGLGR